MFLSGGMMFEWLGDRFALDACARAGSALTRAVEQAFVDGSLVPAELGVTAGTRELTERVRRQVEQRGGYSSRCVIFSSPSSFFSLAWTDPTPGRSR